MDARSVAALHRLRFERAFCFLCLTPLRVTWTRGLLQWVGRGGSQVFACLLVLHLWPLTRVFLRQLGPWRLLSQRRIRSVRLRVGLLRGLLTLVLLLCLLSLTFLDLSSRCFLSLAVLLLPLLVVGLALLRLTFLDVPFLTLLQLALLAGLRLPLLEFTLLLYLALPFQHRLRLDCLFALRLAFALRLRLLEVLAHLHGVLLLRKTILLFAFLSRLRRNRSLHACLEVEHLLRT